MRRHACFLRFLLALGRLDPRNEALMKAVVNQGRTARHSWLIACDAHMCPDDFEKSLWFQSRHMFIKAAEEGVSTCRKKVQKVICLRERMITSSWQDGCGGRF